MKSIKKRLIVSHFIAITLSVVLIEVICIIIIRNYYYNNIEENLKKQASTLTVFYSDYFSSKSTSEYIENIAENIYNSPNVQVQIISNQNKIIWDSLGLKKGTKMDCYDVNYAIKHNKTSKWVGVPEYTEEKCMCFSNPVADSNSSGNPTYVIRLVSSLKNTDSFINIIAGVFIAVGVVVIIVISLVSIVISNTIINPLNRVISGAEIMAKGDFSKKLVKVSNDEVGILCDTLNYMEDEILKNEKLKNDFISSVSHELRTPLTSIIGWAITLNREDFTDQKRRREGLEIITKEGERLSNMVEELLDFSKLESHRIKLSIDDVDLYELIGYTLNELKPKFTASGITINKNLNEVDFIKGDPNRLRQVFINILDNSVKFTESGGEISVSLFMDNDYVQIIFEDTGSGILEEDLPKVLTKFYKTDMKKGGSGIGLAICDEIIKLHGGKLAITSKLNVVTKITIYLKK